MATLLLWQLAITPTPLLKRWLFLRSSFTGLVIPSGIFNAALLILTLFSSFSGMTVSQTIMDYEPIDLLTCLAMDLPDEMDKDHDNVLRFVAETKKASDDCLGPNTNFVPPEGTHALTQMLYPYSKR